MSPKRRQMLEEKIVKFEDKTLTILQMEDPKKLWGMTVDEVAKGYGISPRTVQTHLTRHPDEIREGYERGTSICITPGGAQEKTVVYRDGVIKLGFFIRSDKAKLFRQWATDLLSAAMDQVPQYAPEEILYSHKEAFLQAKQPYFKEALSLLGDLEAQKTITVATVLAHRAVLLREIAGIDLMKAPRVSFENVSVVSPAEMSTAGTIGASIIPVINKEGFFGARDIQDEFGLKNTATVGVIARHLGIYQSIIETESTEWGIKRPVHSGGVLVSVNPLYNQKAKDAIAEVLKDEALVKRLYEEKYPPKVKVSAKSPRAKK